MKLKWSIHQLYFYLVCFVTLIMVIVGIIQLVSAGIELFVPLPQYAEPQKPYYTYTGKTTLNPDIIEKEIQAQKEYQQQANKKNAANNTVTQLMHGLSLLLVAFPAYLYHWRRIPLLGID